MKPSLIGVVRDLPDPSRRVDGTRPAALHTPDAYRPDERRDGSLDRLVPIRSTDPFVVQLFAGSSQPIPSAVLVVGGANGNLMSKTSGRTGLSYLTESGALVAGRNTLIPVDQRPIPRQTYLTSFRQGDTGAVPLSDATMQKYDALMAPDMQQTVAVNVTDPADVSARLKPLLGTQSALIHAALPPGTFGPLLKAMEAGGVSPAPPQAFRRVLLEKPFGEDYHSAVALGEQVKDSSTEVLVLDHFLAYPGMLNLTSFRLDPDIDTALTRDYVDHVDMRMLESVKGNERQYLRDTGSLKDMVQNHFVQFLGTLGMEMPQAEVSAASLQRGRTAVVNAVHIDPASVRMGQFEGFNDPQAGAPPGAPPSKAETFVGFKFKVDTPRWDGVDFNLIQAKGVARKRTGADIHLKKLPPRLAERLQVPADSPAIFHVTVQPDPSITIELPNQRRTVQYDFDDRINPMPPYARLISDALKGDKSLFVEPDAAIAGWKMVESVADGWRQRGTAAFHYPVGADPESL